MYVFLGNDVSVPADDIIAVLDIEKTTVVKAVNDFLSNCQKKGKIYYVTLDMPKSFIICRNTVYVSPISTATIKKRCRNERY